MLKRKAMNRNKSKKLFTRTADGTHRFNLQAAPMRGGIRM
jgi:hypothetical protein